MEYITSFNNKSLILKAREDMTDNDNKWYVCTKAVPDPEYPQGNPLLLEDEKTPLSKIKRYIPDVDLDFFLDHFRAATEDEIPPEPLTVLELRVRDIIKHHTDYFLTDIGARDVTEAIKEAFFRDGFRHD